MSTNNIEFDWNLINMAQGNEQGNQQGNELGTSIGFFYLLVSIVVIFGFISVQMLSN